MAKDYICCKLAEKSDVEMPKATDVSDVKISDSDFSDEGGSFIELVEAIQIL